MTCGYKNASLALLACALSINGGSFAHAGQDKAQFSISGRVSPALKLSIGKDFFNAGAGLSVKIEQSAISSAVITLRGDMSSPSRLVIPIEIRTNVAYEVKMERLHLKDHAPELVARVASVRASGKGCAAIAVENSEPSGPFDLMSARGEASMIRGPRVSLAGNFDSPMNALVIDLHIDAGESAGNWQAAFRVWVEQATGY